MSNNSNIVSPYNDDIDIVIKMVNDHANDIKRLKEQQHEYNRQQYEKIGQHANRITYDEHRRDTRANIAKQMNNLRSFIVKMAVIILVSTTTVAGINITSDSKIPTLDNEEKIEYSDESSTSIIDSDIDDVIINDTELYSEQNYEPEEHIFHYETEDINRDNLSADTFCKKLDDFLAENGQLYGDNLEEKTWNLLYNQIGCSGEQSAAILANMLVEDPSLNPYQHQIFNGIDSASNENIVENDLGIGPFQFSGSRKKSFLKFVKNSAEYSDLYKKFTTPKNYSATTQTELIDTDLSRLGLTEDDCDRGLKCVFSYISYEMQYPDDSNYNRSQWNKATPSNPELNEDTNAADLAISFAQHFERTESGYERRADIANEMYFKYFTFGTT